MAVKVALANNTVFVYTARTHCARGGEGCSVAKRFIDSKRMAERAMRDLLPTCCIPAHFREVLQQ